MSGKQRRHRPHKPKSSKLKTIPKSQATDVHRRKLPTRLAFAALPIVLGLFATVIFGVPTYFSRVQIDAKDVDASAFWNTRFPVTNNGQFDIRNVETVCRINHTVTIAGPIIRDAKPLLHPEVEVLKSEDSFDAKCDFIRNSADIVAADVDVIIGYDAPWTMWRSVTCARFVGEAATDRLPSMLRWLRKPASDDCRKVYFEAVQVRDDYDKIIEEKAQLRQKYEQQLRQQHEQSR